MIKNLGIPYMGSKKKIAPQIVDFIMKENPKTKYVYDLFGGGGAVSFCFAQYENIEKVFYNDFDTAIVALMEKLKNEEFSDEFYQWIGKDDFNILKRDRDWFGGFVSTVFAFGNNKENCFLYSKENENLKKLLHEIVVCQDLKSRDLFYKQYDVFIPDDEIFLDFDLFGNKSVDSVNNRTNRILNFVGKSKKTTERLQHLERVRQLERTQKFKQFEKFEINNKSYDDVEIKGNVEDVIIYCDPPYEGTSCYESRINHKEFLKFVKNSPYKIYVSSYEFDLPCVLQIKHRNILSSTKNNLVIEKLFCNK